MKIFTSHNKSRTTLIMAICITLILAMSLPLFAEGTQLDGHDIPRGDIKISAALPLEVSDAGFFSYLSDEERDRLFQNGELIYRHDGDFTPLLAPLAEDRVRLASEHRNSGNDFALEVLMAMELPAGSTSMSDEAIDLLLYNELLKISTLTGLEYFSASRGVLREFYLSSNVIDDPRSRNILPDLIATSTGDSFDFTILQEDASFGTNAYRVITSSGVIRMSNLETMRYNFVPIAGPGDLKLEVHLFRQGNIVYFYAVTSLQAPRIFGIRNKISNSFYNRIAALYNWYEERLSGIDFF